MSYRLVSPAYCLPLTYTLSVRFDVTPVSAPGRNLPVAAMFFLTAPSLNPSSTQLVR